MSTQNSSNRAPDQGPKGPLCSSLTLGGPVNRRSSSSQSIFFAPACEAFYLPLDPHPPPPPPPPSPPARRLPVWGVVRPAPPAQGRGQSSACWEEGGVGVSWHHATPPPATWLPDQGPERSRPGAAQIDEAGSVRAGVGCSAADFLLALPALLCVDSRARIGPGAPARPDRNS